MWFRKREPRELDDPDFGHITQKSHGDWEGRGFALWGYSSIQILLAAGSDGPSEKQRAFVQQLRSNPDELRDRIETAISAHAKQTSRQKGPLILKSIFLPTNAPEQWRLWYDLDGEDQLWYGAEMIGVDRITPFSED